MYFFVSSIITVHSLTMFTPYLGSNISRQTVFENKKTQHLKNVLLAPKTQNHLQLFKSDKDIFGCLVGRENQAIEFYSTKEANSNSSLDEGNITVAKYDQFRFSSLSNDTFGDRDGLKWHK